PGTQDGLLGAQRIGSFHESVERRSGPFEVGRRDERDGDGFGQPGADERVSDDAALTLPLGQPADLLAGPRHGATDGVEPDPAGDLFDDVDLALEVGTERRGDGDDVVAAAVHVDAQRPERIEDLGVPEVGAEDTVDLARADVNVHALDRYGVFVDRLGRDARPGDLGEELHGPFGVV